MIAPDCPQPAASGTQVADLGVDSPGLDHVAELSTSLCISIDVLSRGDCQVLRGVWRRLMFRAL